MANKHPKSKQSSKLLELKDILSNQIDDQAVYNYAVPDLWNAWDYNGSDMVKTDWGELLVNPFNFYHEVINSYILPRKKADKDYTKSLSKLNKRNKINTDDIGGDWIKQSIVYSIMIRTSTSWDHDRTGDLEISNLYSLKETGTFVKTIALLPLLKKMGIDTIYMLPISKFSLKDKKGELGSPYGVSNFFDLDPNLKDPITGDEFSVEDEFQAFVEACHMLDMRVMIDIIPRTNSVESDLIVDHPEWFYWIDKSAYNDYFPPKVPGVGSTVSPKKEYMPNVYQSEQVWDHISKFSFAPNIVDPNRWEDLVKEYRSKENASIIEMIEETFDLTIAPAFSDHINDVQPPWTDVTFFRMYLDHPNETRKYLKDKSVPPYILFDTIKSNLYKGDTPNKELWELLSDVIPYYQNKYGIDGARIDMGHALPSELLDMIIKKARDNDPDFCFIAEELEAENAETARNLGYNMIIGNGFTEEPRTYEHRLHAFMYDSRNLPCPVFACGETHDTPRLAAREGGRILSKMLTIMNMFMPNAVPFINSGQEVYETQPMNTGLDSRPNEQYMLDPNDRYYGKLALFDKYAIHYLNHMRWDLADNLDLVSNIRNTHIDTFTNLDNFVPIGFEHPGINAVGFGYVEAGKKGQDSDNVFLVFANTDPHNETHTNANITELRKVSGNTARQGKQIYSIYEGEREVFDFDQAWNLNLHLQPGEVRIIKL